MKDEDGSLIGMLVRGFIVALPVLMMGLVIAKGYQLLAGCIRPLLEAMPGTLFHSPAVRFCAVLLAAAGFLLLIGAFSRARIGRATGRWIELALLSRLPLYNTLRTVASGLVGHAEAQSMQPILVTVDVPGLEQLGLIVERCSDGRAVVYLPSSPNPGSGTVVIVDASRMRELHVPMRSLLQCLGRWGNGTVALMGCAVGTGIEMENGEKTPKHVGRSADRDRVNRGGTLCDSV